MVSGRSDPESNVRVSRTMQLLPVRKRKGEKECGNRMVGIACLTPEIAPLIRARIEAFCENPAYDGSFWEAVLYEKDRFLLPARLFPDDGVTEINTYEQLRELDRDSEQLKSGAIAAIARALQADEGEISGITALKKGMTNRSFLFTCRGKKYIMRIPGEGTERLINRRNEAAVYDRINNLGICDRVVYINPDNGFKITEFIENARTCDPDDPDDLAAAMKKLRLFHEKKLKVAHSFDIFGQIDFYESLWEGRPSVFRDYDRTKAGVFSLRDYISAHAAAACLTHIDAVPDNFLFAEGQEEPCLIDWEYAGMQDPHVDIAMFCIYAFYDRAQSDRLMDLYFNGSCPMETRIKIYCYMAACGLLWSNWCEYKRALGVEFGEYALRQYRYAKDFYRIASGLIGEEGK